MKESDTLSKTPVLGKLRNERVCSVEQNTSYWKTAKRKGVIRRAIHQLLENSTTKETDTLSKAPILGKLRKERVCSFD